MFFCSLPKRLSSFSTLSVKQYPPLKYLAPLSQTDYSDYFLEDSNQKIDIILGWSSKRLKVVINKGIVLLGFKTGTEQL